MQQREKKWAERLPRRHVHGTALGGVIKHMGWKLSSFTLCSRGVAGSFFFFFCCSFKVKFIHEHKPEANLLTCVSQTRQTWPWRRSQTDRELQPRPAAPSWSSSPCLPSSATRCLTCTFNNVQSPDEAPRLHKWLIYSSFKKKKMLLHQRAPNPGRKKIQSCHSLVASQISLH